MFCPKCATPAVEGQRFCRGCGTNLGLILDAMDGRPQRSPLDFETLKRDLRDLGSSLRSGFEEASTTIKRTQRLKTPPEQPMPAPLAPVVLPDFAREINKAVRKVKAAHTRKYSFQQAALSLFGGGALLFVWYQLLNAAGSAGLLDSIETLIETQTHTTIEGLAPLLRLLWMLALIPMARGVAHLINGIFFAPKAELAPAEPIIIQQGVGSPYLQPQPPPAYTPAFGQPDTNDLEERRPAPAQPLPVTAPSVTEDATLRFEPK